MARILVTGAGGLLGSRLVPRLAAQGHLVWGVVRPGRAHTLKAGEAVELDLAKPSFERSLPSVDAVVHLAQSPRYREFPNGATELVDVSLRAAVALAERAAGAGTQQFLFASTGSVYGPCFEPLSEDWAAWPDDFHGRTKRCAELLLQCYEGRLDVKVVRPFAVFGAGQRPTMAIPSIVGRVLRDEPVRLEMRPGSTPAEDDEGMRLNPIWASDAAECLVRLLGVPGSCVLNLAGGERVSVRWLAQTAGRLAGIEARFEKGTTPRRTDLVADISALQARIGPVRFTPLVDSIGELVALMKGEVASACRP